MSKLALALSVTAVLSGTLRTTAIDDLVQCIPVVPATTLFTNRKPPFIKTLHTTVTGKGKRGVDQYYYYVRRTV
ncbi:hypothetical protein [Vibrio phage phiKT1028]|nr:hypothetical protein [Vibrio phage phiKT1028]